MSDITVNGYPLPSHLSHSALTTFLSCGHKYFLSRVKRVEEKPAWWFIGGNAVHTASEEWDRYVEAGADAPSDTNFFLDALALHVAEAMDEHPDLDPLEYRAGGRASKAYPLKENLDWWLDKGPDMFEAWKSWRNGSGWSILDIGSGPMIEVGIDFSINDDTLVRMFIDRVMVNEHGEMVILDLKSGSSGPKSPLQLAVYAYGLEKTFGIRPQWGTYWMARDGVTSQLINLDKYPADDVEYILSGFDKLRKSGIFLPNLDECGWCGFKDSCDWGNR